MAVKPSYEELERRVDELRKEVKKCKQIEDERERSLSQLRATLDATADGILVVDSDGKIVAFNKRFVKMWNIPAAIINSRDDDQALTFVMDQLKDPEGFFKKVRELYAHPDAKSFDTLEFRDGRIVERYSRPQVLDGKSIGRVWSFRDVTERHRTEMKLQENREKYRTVLETAPDPIVVGNAELAIDDVPEWNPAKECLEEIRNASVRAKDVVRQILSISRHSLIGRKPLRAGVIIKKSLKLLRSSIPSTIDIHQNLSARSDTVLAEPTHINQILMNLCANAYQAMSDKGGTMEVNLMNLDVGLGTGERNLQSQTHLTPGKYLVLNINDTGHGINPEIRERILDPYFTTKDVGEGTGMGLAVVNGIVQKYAGGIEIDSAPGKGTSVTVYLPLSDQEPEEEVQAVESLPTGTERILFVDDEEGLVRAYSQALKSLGYDVVPCTNPMKALEIFKKEPENFDLVITDMTMPEMTGDKLTKALNSIRPNTPIVLCSGFSNLISQDEARALGIMAFSAKPLVKKDLAKIVRQVLDKE